MNLELRRAMDHDWPAVERLLVANALPLDGAREHLGEFLVAASGGEVIGCAGLELHGAAGLLRSVAVDVRHRGTGIARALTAAAIARAQEADVLALYLLTTTAADYFARHGFVTVGRETAPAALSRSEEFRGACPETATMQVLRLGANA